MFWLTIGIWAAPTIAAEEPAETGLPPLGVAETVRQLDAADWLLQAEAIAAVERYGLRSVGPRLRRMVADSDRPAWLRGRAMTALAHLRPAEARDLAGQHRDHPESTWRAAAARTFGVLGESGDIKILEEMVRTDDSAEVRAAALRALASADPTRAWPHTRQRLTRPLDADTVEPLVRTLLAVNSEASRSALRGMLGHESSAVRTAVAETLVRRQVDEAAAWLVIRLTEADSPDERRHLKSLLPQLPPEEVADALGALLAEPKTDAETFRAGLAVLEQVAGARTAARLVDALPEIARRHSGLLGRTLDMIIDITGKQHRGAIADLLDDQYPWYVRRDAVDALGRLEVDHFRLLAPLIDTEHRYLRGSVLSVLADRTEGAPEEGIVAYLAPIFQHVDEDATSAVAAMRLIEARVSEEEVDRLIARIRPLINHDHREIREQAMGLLKKVADEDAARHLAASRGYVTDWRLAGPFPNDEANSGLATVFPPERSVDLEAVYEGADDREVRWRHWRADSVEAVVPLHKIMPIPVEHRTAYAVTTFEAPSRQQVDFTVEADESFKLFLNGGKIAERGSPGRKRVRVPVERGENELLIKVTNRTEWWRFSVRLLDPAGRPLEWMLEATTDEAE